MKLTYFVKYRTSHSEDGTAVVAETKEEAFLKAVTEVIPKKEGEVPYIAWVSSVTYPNGSYKIIHL